MSKAHFAHYRYVAVEMTGNAPSRRALQNAIGKAGKRQNIPDERRPQVTRFAWPHAILRFEHHDVDAAREWLGTLEQTQDGPIAVRTLSTSGTIKSLTDRLGILTRR